MAHRQLSAAEATNQPVQQAKPMLASSRLAFPSFPLFLFFHCLLLISPFPFLLSFPFSSFSSSFFFLLKMLGYCGVFRFLLWAITLMFLRLFNPTPPICPGGDSVLFLYALMWYMRAIFWPRHHGHSLLLITQSPVITTVVWSPYYFWIVNTSHFFFKLEMPPNIPHS